MECEIEGCEREANTPGAARGLCRGHYRRWQRYGTPYEPVRKQPSWKGVPCRCCGQPVYAKGLCEPCYAASRRKESEQRVRNEQYRLRLEAKRVAAAAGRPRANECDICGEPGRTVWDHCHQSGSFRGWLCQRCNRVLGSVKDDTELLVKLAIYLEGCRGEVVGEAS